MKLEVRNHDVRSSNELAGLPYFQAAYNRLISLKEGLLHTFFFKVIETKQACLKSCYSEDLR